MKKTALMALALVLFISFPLSAQTSNANQDYISAMTTTNVAERIRLLKEYLAKYAGRGTQYENFVHANLCITPFKGKTARETIEHGEKALTLGGLDDITKCNVLMTVSAIYSQRSQNLEKAKNYAFQVVQIAQANKSKRTTETTPEQWNKLIGAGYLTLGQAQEKAKDLKGAVDSYISSYEILKNPQILNSLKRTGKSLYDFKFYREAEKAFELSAATLKDYASIYFYAKTLHRNKKKEEALKYYKQAYAKQKSGDTAYNIGIILADKAKSNPSFSQEAIRYLLDASFLSAANSKKAMELAEFLFFTTNKDLKYNENVKEIQKKNKNLEELTNAFNKKYGEKDEEDLSDAEKKEMEGSLTEIESEQKALQKLKADQKVALDKFNKLIEETKQRLGIR